MDTDLYNLNRKLRRCLVRLGVMLPPEKLVRKTVDAMFRKKAAVIPGVLNRIALPIVRLIPHSFIRWVARTSGVLPLER